MLAKNAEDHEDVIHHILFILCQRYQSVIPSLSKKLGKGSDCYLHIIYFQSLKLMMPVMLFEILAIRFLEDLTLTCSARQTLNQTYVPYLINN